MEKGNDGKHVASGVTSIASSQGGFHGSCRLRWLRWPVSISAVSVSVKLCTRECWDYGDVQTQRLKMVEGECASVGTVLFLPNALNLQDRIQRLKMTEGFICPYCVLLFSFVWWCTYLTIYSFFSTHMPFVNAACWISFRLGFRSRGNAAPAPAACSWPTLIPAPTLTPGAGVGGIIFPSSVSRHSNFFSARDIVRFCDDKNIVEQPCLKNTVCF